MAQQDKKEDVPYQYRDDAEPHKQTGNINSRNNNASGDTPPATEPDVERANDSGIGDSGWNDEKLTNYTQNHSSDA
jgi:hypothetical protein